jgi:hypothetical protein
MNGMSQRFRVNSHDVVHETIDGEVIAIDLGRGSYYNLAGGAVPVWQLLARGATADQLVSAFTVDESDRAGVRESVEELLERLAAESLIVAEPVDAGANHAGPPAEVGFEFEAPRFEKYDDMQDFFLLDPIHEVDASGWPAPQPD